MKRFLKKIFAIAGILTASVSANAADYTLPFELNPTQQIFNSECVVVDVNNDGEASGIGTWTYADKSFKFAYHSTNNGDDWLFLPLVDFGATTTVTVSFTAKTGVGNEAFDVYLGTSQEIDAMTVPVISKENYCTKDKEEEISATVKVPVGSSDWCLGFHAVSEKDQYFLYIKDIRIEASAGEVTIVPGAPTITSSSMDFLNYSASVKMPETDQNGETITGTMNLKVTLDGKLKEEFSDLSAGAIQEISFVLEEGEQTIGYQALLDGVGGNTASETVTAERETIVPGVPSVANGSVEGLTFKTNVVMPSKDTQGRDIDGDMTLRVSENDVNIQTYSTLAPGAEVEVELPLTIGTHTLLFNAILNGVESQSVSKEITIEAPTYELPFSFIPSRETMQECVVEDGNNDKNTWKISDGAFNYSYSETNDADDWLILPIVECGSARKVKITMNVKTGSMAEGFEVWLGNERTSEGMTVKAFEKTGFKAPEAYVTVEGEVELPASESAEWAIGIHAISEKDMFELFIQEITMEEEKVYDVIPSAPEIMSDSLEGGVFTATIAMPSISTTDEDLTSTMTLKVTVDAEEVLTKENLQPGVETEIELSLEAGRHTIGFIAVLEGAESEAATIRVTVKASDVATGQLPYTFKVTQESFDSCEVIDVNGDGTSNESGVWSYIFRGEAKGGGALKFFAGNEDADDWIILPMVDFGESTGVTVSFNVETEADIEDFEIWLGKERSVEGMTLKVMDCNNYKHYGSYETLSKAVVLPEHEVQPQADGNEWCLGFHVTSPADRYAIYINNIEIKNLPTTAVTEILDSMGDVEYFNLQGMRLSKPIPGSLIIVRKGEKVCKTIIR